MKVRVLVAIGAMTCAGIVAGQTTSKTIGNAQQGPTGTVEPVVVHFIPAPDDGTFGDLIWPDRDRLVLSYHLQEGRVGDDHLYDLSLDDLELRRLPIPDDPDCRTTDQMFPRLLSDGRIAFLQRCIGGSTRAPYDLQASLMVFNPDNETTDQLLPYPVPSTGYRFDFSPDMTVGIIDEGPGAYAQLWWLYPDRAEPIGLRFRESVLPSWSPDGKQIAFVTTPGEYGRPEPSRALSTQALYLMDRDGSGVRPLIEGLRSARLPVWSPDGRWLACTVGARTTEFPEYEVWLIDPTTGRSARLMAEKWLDQVAWSPDGQSLAVTVGALPGLPGARDIVGLYILELPEFRTLSPGSPHAASVRG
jgi:hypothetical protein